MTRLAWLVIALAACGPINRPPPAKLFANGGGECPDPQGCDAPIEETVRGEAAEIYPYLGSSRLEEPLGRHPVSAIFHGHAHHGQLRGKTRTGVPVYNVAAPLLAGVGRPFHVLEIGGAPPGAGPPDSPDA